MIRLAGVPFDVLERLATTKSSAAARAVLVARDALREQKHRAEEFVTRRDNGMAPEQFHAWRSALRCGGVVAGNVPDELRAYAETSRALHAAEAELERYLTAELNDARRSLVRDAKAILPAYLLFASVGTQHLFVDDEANLPTRNSRARERERHLLLYLQRVAAKNDTFGEFGPSTWGVVGDGHDRLNFSVQPGIAKREAFLERWTAHAMAAAMNSDPDIFAELSPRLDPNSRLVGDQFIVTDTGETVALSAEEMEFVQRCDGHTPAYSLGVELVREMTERNVLVTRVEVPAFESHAIKVLAADVRRWRGGEARDRWSQVLDELAAWPVQLAHSKSADERATIVNGARDYFSKLGAERTPGGRSLYAAVNPIGEECSRTCTFELSAKHVDEVTADAAPWIDLWRDTYAFVASRVAGNLRGLLHKAPMNNGAIALPAFLRFCDAAQIPLAGPGLVGMAHIAFQEVKTAFRERLKPHASEAEYELTADDCHIVRKNFEYPKFDEYTYPSADLQLAAASPEAVNRGEYQWIVAELHPPAATLHHALYWSCPDPGSLARALASTVDGKPTFHFGFFAADFTAHTAVRLFESMPGLTNFVAPQRANPDWRYVPPAETEVFVDDASGDVGLRHATTQEYLGSFARAWLIPLGFHPFQFALSPHTPRLRCGRTIVQRRTWTIAHDELEQGNFTGVSRDLVLAIEKLRAVRDLPRFVYIRPTEQALRRAGAVGRDKDTKPVFVDFESYLSLEIFHRWLVKAGELELTEMLPAPDQLLWREADGRRTFEMRTLIVPRT